MSNITINMEKLSDEQLEALALIDAAAVELEKKRRVEESIYTEEEVKNYQIYSDLHKAYFFLKPMYDNMRNGDTKKTITSSNIIPVLEKVFRWTKFKNIKFAEYSPVVENEAAPAPAPEPKPVVAPVPAPEPKPVGVPAPAPAPEPKPVEVPAPAPEPVAQISNPIPPVPSAAPRPLVAPVSIKAPIPSVASKPIVPPMPTPPSFDPQHMSVEEINEIMSKIPVVGGKL